MERLVRLDAADDLDTFIEEAGWHRVDGIELDLTDISEARYQALEELLQEHRLHVTSLHYERTRTVALKEEELFRSQLDMLVEKCRALGCGHVSIHPPRVEIGETHTVQDLQDFMRMVDRYAADADVRIAFELAGFMHDPQLMNLALSALESPSLGVMVDLGELPAGVDPDRFLDNLTVGIDKMRIPLPYDQMLDIVDRGSDIIAVADTL